MKSKAFLAALNKDFKVPSLDSGVDDVGSDNHQNYKLPKYAYNKGTNANIKTTTTMPKIADAVGCILEQQKSAIFQVFVRQKIN